MKVTEAVRQFWRVVPKEQRRAVLNMMRQGMPLPFAAAVVGAVFALSDPAVAQRIQEAG